MLHIRRRIAEGLHEHIVSRADGNSPGSLTCDGYIALCRHGALRYLAMRAERALRDHHVLIIAGDCGGQSLLRIAACRAG